MCTSLSFLSTCRRALLVLSVVIAVSACSPANSPLEPSNESVLMDTPKTPEAWEYLKENVVYNGESVIPPQCYTKTESKHNPCYMCHQTYPTQPERPNMMADAHLQGEYAFSDLGLKNHWKNLFVDRTEALAAIDDAFIQTYVSQDNYTALITRLEADASWEGEIAAIKHLADPALAFGDLGIANDGSHWVAFNYKPFPSTFWPTNGSTGDVMIRLGQAFREKDNVYQQDVYFANLSLVEMAIKDLPRLSTPPLSEHVIGQDLNGNGVLEDVVTDIVRQSHYVGDAQNIALAHMLYPQDTEILHTVRYVGINDQGQIVNARRMKEVRYMKKHVFLEQNDLKAPYYQERKEKHFEQLPKTTYHGDKGIANNFGWTINAYIEDKQGELRQQHQQELAFCNGCHKTIGSTIDQTFSFPRKVEGAKGWGYINLSVQQDTPSLNTSLGEYLTYMQRVNGGDEFRQNQEMLARWFTADARVDVEKVQAASSLAELILPSPERAIKLNKAYYDIVQTQSYIFGRDATWLPATNVFENVDPELPPLDGQFRHQTDIRLDWHSSN